MRSSLSTVIRLQRWQVDAERRCVNEADAALSAIDAALAALAQSCAEEGRHAAAAIETGAFAFGPFLARVRRRREALETQRVEAVACLEDARARLAAAYREQRKFELADAEQRRRAAAEAARKEQQALDEMAIIRHARRATAGGGNGRR